MRVPSLWAVKPFLHGLGNGLDTASMAIDGLVRALPALNLPCFIP